MREGGSYRLVLTYKDASDAPGKTSADSDISTTRIVAIVPGERSAQQVDLDSHDAAFHGTSPHAGPGSKKHPEPKLGVFPMS